MSAVHRVLTAVGEDRPGLVQALSAAVRKAGANLEDGRMALLGGEFAFIVLFSGDADAVAAAEREATRVGSELGLSVAIRATRAPAAGRGYLRYRLQATGLDRPGIVEAVTHVLAAREVNVSSLETRLVHAPLSGTPTFLLEAELQVPPSVSLPDLRRALTEAAERENLDLQLEPLGG